MIASSSIQMVSWLRPLGFKEVLPRFLQMRRICKCFLTRNTLCLAPISRPPLFINVLVTRWKEQVLELWHTLEYEAMRWTAIWHGSVEIFEEFLICNDTECSEKWENLPNHHLLCWWYFKTWIPLASAVLYLGFIWGRIVFAIFLPATIIVLGWPRLRMVMSNLTVG